MGALKRLRNIISSLRTKAAVVAIAFVLALVTVTGVIVIRHEKLALTREVELRVLSQARSIAASSERTMLEPDPELTFQKLLREMMSRDPDIESIVVVDDAGMILAHPEVTKIGTRYEPPAELNPVRDINYFDAEEMIAEGEDVFLVNAPIKRTYEGQVLTIGRVYIRSSKGKIEKAIGSAQFQIIIIAVIVSLLGSIAAVILSGFITTPIKKLAKGDFVDEILKAVAVERYDLLVLGAYGHQRPKYLKIISDEALNLVRLTTRPVLVYREPSDKT